MNRLENRLKKLESGVMPGNAFDAMIDAVSNAQLDTLIAICKNLTGGNPSDKKDEELRDSMGWSAERWDYFWSTVGADRRFNSNHPEF